MTTARKAENTRIWKALVAGSEHLGRRGNLKEAAVLRAAAGIAGGKNDRKAAASRVSNFKAQNVLRVLLAEGIPHDPRDKMMKERALLFAIENGRTRVVRKLLEHGVDIERPFQSRYGETPLMRAAGRGFSGIVALLLDAGAKWRTKDTTGSTAFMDACRCGDPQTLRLLLDRGASIHAPDSQGWTPLMYAASAGRVNVVRLLLDLGANPAAKNKLGQTALDLSTLHANVEDVLLERQLG